MIGTAEIYEEAKSSLERMQNFNVDTLPRITELGSQLNFQAAKNPAQLLVDLYKRLSLTALDDFPDAVLAIVRDNANSHYSTLKRILEFTLEQGNPGQAQTALINELVSAYAPTFTALHPYISYSLHRSADFQSLDSTARATLQSIEDKANTITASLTAKEEDATKALEEIRKVAAEQGITQQAVHFSAEYEFHTTEAERWRKTVVKLIWSLGLFSILSLFLHKISYLKPTDTYDAIQLSISKFMLFSVLAYSLFLSSKNFLNHKHNAIINKHRQNALLTHGALVEASGEEGVRDAVLLQAASCIFSPQSTGYASASDFDGQKSMVEIFSKPISNAVKP